MKNQIIPQRRTIHTFHQTQLAFFVEYNARLFELWRNGRTHSAAYRMCQTRIEDLRHRLPQVQRVQAMWRFLTDGYFFTDNGSKSSLFYSAWFQMFSVSTRNLPTQEVMPPNRPAVFY